MRELKEKCCRRERSLLALVVQGTILSFMLLAEQPGTDLLTRH